jgi:hypothetical protein
VDVLDTPGREACFELRPIESLNLKRGEVHELGSSQCRFDVQPDDLLVALEGPRTNAAMNGVRKPTLQEVPEVYRRMLLLPVVVTVVVKREEDNPEDEALER